jgi:hypothetical protein
MNHLFLIEKTYQKDPCTLPVSRVRRSQIITCYREGERKRGRGVREREGVKERCEEGDRGEHY